MIAIKSCGYLLSAIEILKVLLCIWWCKLHDDVIKWKHFPHYWPFVRGIHRSQVNSPHKSQWRRALMVFFYLRLSKRLSIQSWGWWFETLSHSLWRHCNGYRQNYVFNKQLSYDYFASFIIITFQRRRFQNYRPTSSQTMPDDDLLPTSPNY